ncbi:hypothetical protein NC652_037171 [Populus alba x Populus x berolinensis]|jgi:hypothetical protein|nr:hypothetical protein NC652_037020 [Populus alba x Populus x berolinensis]KAJ6871728.1 hypothetical protein NC652_037171 [Populus alba x Populus x berolinensis]
MEGAEIKKKTDDQQEISRLLVARLLACISAIT